MKKYLACLFFSDAIRLFLINRFGGWYSDLDMTIIRQLSQYRNVIASDNVMEDDFLLNKNNYGDKVSNAIFHFDAGSESKTKILSICLQSLVFVH